MSTEPSESRVRDLYANATAWDFSARDERPDLARLRSNAYDEFDQWLDAHDAEVRADFVLTRANIRKIKAAALREAAESARAVIEIGSSSDSAYHHGARYGQRRFADWLDVRADRIEREA